MDHSIVIGRLGDLDVVSIRATDGSHRYELRRGAVVVASVATLAEVGEYLRAGTRPATITI